MSNPKTMHSNTIHKTIPPILICLFLISNLQAQETEPKIGTCDGEQIICLTRNMYNLCVEIVVDDSFSSPIDHFIIDWGDGQETRVEGSKTPPNQQHVYDLTSFFNTNCLDRERYNVSLFTVLADGNEKNNGFVLTFGNPPNASFNTPQTVCVGSEVRFINQSCPRSSVEVVSWDYGDGQRGLENKHTYDTPGTYDVTLTVKNNVCREMTDDYTRQITVIEQSEAIASPESGVVDLEADTFVVCLGGGGQVILDGAASINATEYDWGASPRSGYSWVGSNRNRPRDTIIFDTPGDYQITLEVDNPCNIPSAAALNFKVIAEESLQIVPQPDGCQSLNYRPNPMVNGATYLLNGNQEDFPIELPPGEYILTASLSNVCGDQFVQDTFTVSERQTIEIITPDTTICSSSDPIPIEFNNDINTGSCTVNGQPLPDCVFDPSQYSGEDFTIAFENECAESNTVQISVIQTDNLAIDLPTDPSFCITDPPFQINVSDGGGRFSGRGIGNDSIGIYNPIMAGIGLDTLRYELSFSAGGNECPPAFDQRVINVFPELNVAFDILDCVGSVVSFDTINTSAVFSRITYDFGDNTSSNQVAPTHEYAAPGTYNVQVTIEQEGGCEQSFSRMIRVEPAPVAAFQVVQDPNPCSPQTVRFINQSSGGELAYYWDFGNGETSSSADPGAVQFEAIGKDTTYLITLEVTNGCSSRTATQEVFVKAGPNPYFEADKNQHCSGEAVAFHKVLANADENTHYWFWDFGDGRTFTGKFPDPITYETMVQDTFWVSLTVGNDCDTLTYQKPLVVIPSDVTAFMNVDRTVNCANDSIRLINASGVPNAEFYFEDGLTLAGDTVYKVFQTEVDTFFTIQMRVFGCGYDDTTTTINLKAAPQLALSADAAICQNEALQAIVNTDVGNVRIDWGDGNRTDQRIANHMYSNPGNYQITATVTSSLGCANEISQNVQVIPGLNAGFLVDQNACRKASILFQDTTSGNIQATYWDFGDENVMESLNQAEHAYQTSGNFQASMVVVDDQNCRDTIVQQLTIKPLPAIETDYDIPDPCLPIVNFINTTTGSAFEWYFEENNLSATERNPVHDFLEPGNYQVKFIASLEGCRDTQLIHIDIAPWPVLITQVEQPDPCAPSPVVFNATGSEAEQFTWDFGDGTNSFMRQASHTYDQPGTYRALFSASRNGCTIDTTIQITVSPPLLGNMSTQQDVVCFGESTGALAVEMTSGNPPYSFNWSNAQTTNPNQNLPAGNYEITVTDRLGCTLTLSETIHQPEQPVQIEWLTQEDISCFGNADGQLEVIGQGGTGPYTYQWEDQSTSTQRQNLEIGTYFVTITDQFGCQTTDEISIQQPAPLEVSFITEAICPGETGAFEVLVDGGTAPYFVSPFPDFRTEGTLYENLPPGTYPIYVEDVNGCQTVDSITVTQFPDWTLFFSPDTSFILKGDSIRLKPRLSISPTEFIWTPTTIFKNPDLLDQWAHPLRDTEIALSVVDENGCMKSARFMAYVQDTVAVYIPNAFTPGSDDKAGDGVNDYFTAYSNFPAVKQIKEMVIANKYGQIIFQKENFPIGVESEGWDGRFLDEPLQPDEYAYYILVEYVDGTEAFKGIVKLLR